MFEVFCPAHGCRVLLGHSCIEGLRSTGDGPVLDWRCWCGQRGSLVRGRSPRPATGRDGGDPAPSTKVA